MLTATELYERAVGHVNEGRLAAGLRTLDLAHRRDPDPELTARIAGTRAYVLAERGDPAGAVALCELALSTYGLSPGTRAALTGQLGLVLIHAGDLPRAARNLDDAAGGLAHDPRQLGNVLLNRGVLALESGDVAVAESRLTAARGAFETAQRPVGVAKARHGLGIAAQQRGDLVTARTELDAARAVLAPLGPVLAAWSDLALADLLVAAGVLRDAAGLLTDAAHAFGRARMRRQQAETELTLALTQRITDPALAARTARRAGRRFDRVEDPVGALRAYAAEVACELERGPSGVRRDRLIDRAAVLANELAAAGLREEARSLRRHRAAALAAAGSLDAARAEVARLRPRPSESRLARVLHHDIAAQVAAASGRPRAALRRAGAGVELVTAWQDSLAELELRSALAVHTRRLLTLGIELSLGLAEPEPVLAWSERSRGVVARVMDVRPGPPARNGGEDVLDLDLVREQLASDDAVLVSYIGTPAATAAVVVDPDARARLVPLGPWAPIAATIDALRADLDMSAAALPASLADAVARSLARRVDEAAGQLLTPLDVPDRSRLVITASPTISTVPWGMLPGLAGVEVSVAETVRDWLRRARQSERPPAATAGFVVGPGLARAAAEVEACAAAWGDAAHVLPTGSATRAAVAELAGRVDVLHVAAHGRHSVENPLFSAFELDDGPWHGYDIDALARVPSVVVLASCELGRFSGIWGRETIGMVRAWLHAGARCVIASAARVPDTAAGGVVDLHRGLTAGADPARILTRAGPGLPGRAALFTCFGNGW